MVWGLVLQFVASYVFSRVLNNLLAPTPPDQIGPKVNDLKIQKAEHGAVIPLVMGASDKISGFMIWQTDLIEHEHRTEQSGGKFEGPSQTTITYTYTVSFAIGICKGVMAGMLQMWANEELIFDMSGATVESLMASTKNAGFFKFYPGDETQLPDPTMEAEIGAGLVNANRGVCYLVFTDWDVTKWGRIPNLAFRVLPAQTTAIQKLNYLQYVPITFDGSGHNSMWSNGDLVVVVDHQFTNPTHRMLGSVLGGPEQIQNVQFLPADGGLLWCCTGPVLYVWKNTFTGGPFRETYIYNDNWQQVLHIQTDESASFVPERIAIDDQALYTCWCNSDFGGLPQHPRVYKGGQHVAVGPHTILDLTALPHNPVGIDSFFWTDGLYVLTQEFVSGQQYRYRADVFDADTGAFIKTMGPTPPLESTVAGSHNKIHINSTGVYVWCWVQEGIAGAPDTKGRVYRLTEGAAELIMMEVAAPEEGGKASDTFDGGFWTDGKLVVMGVFEDGIGGGSGFYSVKLFNNSPAEVGVPLSSVVTTICAEAKIVAAELGVSSITADLVPGLTISQQTTARTALETLLGPYLVDVVDSDGTLKFVKKGSYPALTITSDELVMDRDDDE